MMLLVVAFALTSVLVCTRRVTAPAATSAASALPSSKLRPTTGMAAGPPRVPWNSSVRPGWPSLKMIAASYPAAAAFAAFTAKSQPPRWISAICGAVVEAGVKSAGWHPAFELGSGVGGRTLSSTGTTWPVTSPLAE